VSGGAETVDALHPSLWAAWVVSGDTGDLAALVAEARRPFTPAAAPVANDSIEKRSGLWLIPICVVIVAVLMWRMRRAA
jgi:hypothetical protein